LFPGYDTNPTGLGAQLKQPGVTLRWKYGGNRLRIISKSLTQKTDEENPRKEKSKKDLPKLSKNFSDKNPRHIGLPIQSNSRQYKPTVKLEIFFISVLEQQHWWWCDCGSVCFELLFLFGAWINCRLRF